MTNTMNTESLAQRARVEELIMKGWPKEDLTTAERMELEDLAYKLRRTESTAELIGVMIADGHGPAYIASALDDLTPAGADRLVAAFHAIFDAKDAAGPGTDVWDAAYEATKALSAFMETVGVPVPSRFDADRPGPVA